VHQSTLARGIACVILTTLAVGAGCGDDLARPPDAAVDAGEIPDARGARDGALVLEVDDAGALLGCLPGPTQCSNCVDDDRDGRFDGFDPGCSSAFDAREASFTSGVPGDHQESPRLDCFFDGNSVAGDDGCRVHACCLLTTCPAALQPFDAARDCTPSARCVATCQRATVQGCDCFGCCRIADGAGATLRTVLVHPAIAPSCDEQSLGDPARCPPCTPAPTCARPCDPAACQLCPGQTAADLPPSCAAWSCPGATAPCAFADQCAAGEACASGCCTPGFE